MSLINRPFRGFSGVYTRPDFDLDSSPRSSTSSIPHPDFAPNLSPPATPPQQQNQKHKRSLFTRSKSSKHLHATAAAEDRPAPPCRAHTAELPPPPAAPRNRFAGLLRRGSRDDRDRRSPEETERELEELYVAVYSKAERRAFFREWKARQEERDLWEVDALERGVVYAEHESEGEDGKR